MTTINISDLKVVMEEVFEERSRIDSHSHGQHHEWIKERIASEQARQEMFWEIAKAVAQWSVIGILGCIVYWFKNGHWPN
jgi:hypothetical protein